MKKIVILENNGGRLANQLWLSSGVYAYCLEKKYIYENRCFFRYEHYFNIQKSDWFLYSFFNRRNIRNSKLAKVLYPIYSTTLKMLNPKSVVQDNKTIFNLPPDEGLNEKQSNLLDKIEKSDRGIFYFCGWLFRTPIGLEKYRKEITEYFKPRKEYDDRVKNFIDRARTGNRQLIGIHVRHGDYKVWNGGKFFYSFKEVRKILESFLQEQENKEQITFIICSDEEINDSIFAGLPYIKGLGSEIEDLYTLASTDKIIGSNSSYGAWASYYGNIPFTTFPEKNI